MNQDMSRVPCAIPVPDCFDRDSLLYACQRWSQDRVLHIVVQGSDDLHRIDGSRTEEVTCRIVADDLIVSLEDSKELSFRWADESRRMTTKDSEFFFSSLSWCMRCIRSMIDPIHKRPFPSKIVQ